jgi:methyl-accepting chemotaxis protein
MRFLRNAKLGVRLSAGFGLMLVLLAIVTVVSISRMRAEDAITERITTTVYPKAEASQRISYLVMDMSRLVRNLVLIDLEGVQAVNKSAYDKIGHSSTGRSRGSARWSRAMSSASL